MEQTQLTANLFAGAQIDQSDITKLAEAGFTDIVCHRPDAEIPDGPCSAKMAERAADLGMAFHYLPIVPGEPFSRQAARLAAVTAKPGAKVFAYCRSGARASAAWTLGCRSDASN